MKSLQNLKKLTDSSTELTAKGGEENEIVLTSGHSLRTQPAVGSLTLDEPRD
jgi:hypothetical protein